MNIIQYKVGDRIEYQCYSSITTIYLIVAERDQKTKIMKQKNPNCITNKKLLKSVKNS